MNFWGWAMDKKNNIEKIWKKYDKKKSKEDRDILIEHYIPLVKYIAGRVNMQVGQYVDFDDLVSYGIFGLIDAIDKYDLSSGNKFETYASLRIRGSIIDAIRKLDWIPRSVRIKSKQIEQAIIDLEQDLGRAPTEEEIAKKLNISSGEYEELARKANVSALVSLDEEIGDDTKETFSNIAIKSEMGLPEEEIDKTELKNMLVAALEDLNDKEKLVISLYYFEELALKEIAAVLEVTDSRVSQIHSKALMKLRAKLGKHQDILFNI